MPIESDVLQPAAYFILALGLSIFATILVRRQYDVDGPELKGISDFVKLTVLRLLLPLLVADALLSNQDKLVPFLTQFAIGLAIPALFLLICRALFKDPSKPTYLLGYTLATFGGGNRGVALIMLAAALLSALGLSLEQNASLGAFVALDLGQFLFFLVALPVLLKPHAIASGVDIKKELQESPLELLGPYALAAVVVAGVYFAAVLKVNPDYPIMQIPDWLAMSASSRSFLLLFLSTFYVFCRMRVDWTSLRMGMALTGLFFVFRGVAIAIVLLVFSLITGITSLPELLIASAESLYIFPIVVLFLCPPSSLLPPLIGKLGFSGVQKQAVDSVSAFSTIIFFAVLIPVALALPFLTASTAGS